MEKRVMTIVYRACVVVIGFILTTIVANAQTLINGGFEIPGGTYTNAANPTNFTVAAANWVQFANGLRTSTNDTGNALTVRSGDFALKCFGSSSWDGEGAYQVISNGVSPGQTYVLNSYGLILSSDPLTNTAVIGYTGQPFGLLQLGFAATNGASLGSFNAPSFTSARGLDTWISSTVTGVAPANAAWIRVYVMELGYGTGSSGSIFFDDVSVVNLNAPIVTNFFQTAIIAGNQICWSTTTNAAYQPQSSVNNVVWTDVGSAIPGDGSTNCTFDAIGSFSSRFYRVLELQ